MHPALGQGVQSALPATAGLGGLIPSGNSLIGVSIPHPSPLVLTLRLAGQPILGGGEASPVFPGRPDPRGREYGGDIGVPQGGGSVGIISLFPAAAPWLGVGCGQSHVASLFGGTGGLVEL